MTTYNINIGAMRVSDHVRYERMDRLTKSIRLAGGIGEVIFMNDSNKAKYHEDRVVNCVTSTGMVFVVNLSRNMIITGYLGTVRYVMGLYAGAGYNRLPVELYQTIRDYEGLREMYGI